jgi:biotin synthase
MRRRGLGTYAVMVYHVQVSGRNRGYGPNPSALEDPVKLDSLDKRAPLGAEDALAVLRAGPREVLDVLAAADRLRRAHRGEEINLCSIVNARSGACPEDCAFCAQSVRYRTGAEVYPLLPRAAILDRAKEARGFGAREFSIVTSGYGERKARDFERISEAVAAVGSETELHVCASLGILTEEQLGALAEAGLSRYHHNLETARSHFTAVCTTHGYEEDYEMVHRAKEAGLYVCSGGIFGMGESEEQRVELAMTLRELDVDSVPVNFLNPIPGTPLEGVRELTPLDCIKIIAMLRLVLPEKDIVVCGGREVNLRDLQSMIFFAGANGMMVGGYLTTSGRDYRADVRMIEDLGLVVRGRD